MVMKTVNVTEVAKPGMTPGQIMQAMIDKSQNPTSVTEKTRSTDRELQKELRRQKREFEKNLTDHLAREKAKRRETDLELLRQEINSEAGAW